MSTSQVARQAIVYVEYNGRDISESVADDLMTFSYTDSAPGQLDDLQITLQDRWQRWQGDWSPTEGDRIKASIRTINWDGPNQFRTLPCGTFEYDSDDVSGPPDTVTIKAVSLPFGSSVRREKRSRAWEKVTLRTLAADVAKNAGLQLLYSVNINPVYERIEQNQQSDLAFLLDTATKEGVALKITNGRLVLFDEKVYEQQPPVATIRREDAINYSFSRSTSDAAYRACEVQYTANKSNKTIKVTYVPPGAPAKGPVLRLNENASSQAEALRLARNRLREQNKNYGRARLTVPGDPRLVSGVTVQIEGWRRYDAKYIVESATHSVSAGGYETAIEIRKVLGW